MKRAVLCLSVLLVGSALLSRAAQATTHEFFRGKTIRLVVGTSVGGAMDDWARLIAPHLGRNIPGSPTLVVQNMPGAGTIIAANYLHDVAKPDGLTLGLVNPGIYVDQLLRAKEVHFDWPKFSFIGSPERVDQVLFIRRDFPQQTLEELRKAPEPPRCSATGRAGLGYLLPRLVEEAFGIKLRMVVGYGGGGDMNLAMERGEIHCRAGTVSAYAGREPTRTWHRTGFVRPLVQSGSKRYVHLPDVPTFYEVAEKYRTPDPIKRVAKVLLSAGDFGRPFFAPPGMPTDRLKTLREAFMKTMGDPRLMAELKKRRWEIDPMSGEGLAALARDVMVQPPETIERIKNLLGN